MVITHKALTEKCNLIVFHPNGYSPNRFYNFAMFSYEDLVFIQFNRIQYITNSKCSISTNNHINKFKYETLETIYLSDDELQRKLQLIMTNQILGI